MLDRRATVGPSGKGSSAMLARRGTVANRHDTDVFVASRATERERDPGFRPGVRECPASERPRGASRSVATHGRTNMAETPRRRASSYEISNTPLAEDWSALIIAIDHVLALDNEEWTKRLAVLTAEALYLLEPETGDPDPLSPFGHTWWRIGMHDLTDIQFVPAEGELRLCTSLCTDAPDLLLELDNPLVRST